MYIFIDQPAKIKMGSQQKKITASANSLMMNLLVGDYEKIFITLLSSNDVLSDKHIEKLSALSDDYQRTKLHVELCLCDQEELESIEAEIDVLVQNLLKNHD